ncbi:hypothetical protein UFOVP1454_57 [uncultured Caudovirales phage]|uniref:Peptidase S74 domain-containing protein n=1 Tax=uncultured Caudovirales phage TaxID=2100421 RepID=A0A6J5SJQ2_9CAUD|nr:hypothetical protein UFOVP1454_57 [uncultured Caudovirales phage]
MPGLFGSLFGSPSSGTQSSNQASGFSALPQFGQDAFKQAVERGTALSQDPSMFAPAGLTPEQTASLATLSAGLQPTSPGQFQTGLSTFGDPYNEQVIQNSIRDINTAGQGQLSDIGSMASAAGGFGGTRQALLEALNQSNTQKNIGDISSQLRSQGFQNAANMTMADIARSQDVAGNLFGLGETQRGINTQTKQAPIAANNYLAQLAQGLPASSYNSSSQVTAGDSKGMLSQLGGAAAAFGGLGTSLGGLGTGLGSLAKGGAALFNMSDSRLKNNIRYLREDNGHKIYEFEYKWSPRKYEGVMAQDILETNPDAVYHNNGFYMVDYSKLGIEMRAI